MRIIQAIFLNFLILSAVAFPQDFSLKTGAQWYPFVEWSVQNPTYEGNPYDVSATVTFRHPSGEERTTWMFYAGEDTWQFRFTGTKTGTWDFVTFSSDPQLDRKKGKVEIEANPNPNAHGFITQFGNKWGWQGTNEAFAPQLVMYDEPPAYNNNPKKIDRDIKTFFNGHGFNGFHTYVLTRWFDLNEPRYDNINKNDPNPDPRTFEALELLIQKAHAAGGMVHIWAWGDESRHQTPMKWRKNGKVDRRLQRYIAARLGPLPGWSMGYGFDCDEWVTKEDLKTWHAYMHAYFGWPHFLGARDPNPNHPTDPLTQIYEGLDYAGYEHHRPTYKDYVRALSANPNKPVFSEDRFRIRKPPRYPKKDYNEVLTRRGLWDSTMAGGVANIWGNLVDAQGDGSEPYPNKQWFKTHAQFFADRFAKDLVRDNNLTDGVCLRNAKRTLFLFYKEDTSAIRMDLNELKSGWTVLAVDALKPYQEIEVDRRLLNDRVWQAPYSSDWAVAVSGNVSSAGK